MEETSMKKLTIAAALAAALGAGIGLLNAQQPGFTRTVLQDQDLTAQGRHAVVARAGFVPRGQARRHTHPGEKLGYGLAGAPPPLLGGPPAPGLKAGGGGFFPPR